MHLEVGEDGLARCGWGTASPDYVAYHDEEWGVPVSDDRRLFEMLVLEGAQAGLSWETILGKREGYRRAFEGFDPAAVAAFDAARVDRLVEDAGIVRHRGKIESAVTNARALLDLTAEHGSFAAWLWGMAPEGPRTNRWRATAELPASTAESERLSRELRRHGFRFVGPTTCYAFMQAAGLVDDHLVGCFRHGRPG